MSRYPSPFDPARPGTFDYEASAEQVDRSVLVQFFNTVYAWMASGLALTAVVAYLVSTNLELMRMLYSGPARLVLFLVTIGLVITISAAVERISAGVATMLFLLYAAIIGALLSSIFVVYSQASLAAAFFVTAGTFGATSVFGMVTKKDLTGMGGFLVMALIGLIIASIVNVFWANSTLYWIVTYAGVLIFAGLTAYDTQRLKHVALATANDPRRAARYAINGALMLYLDFINLFLLLLRIFGDRR